MKKLVIEDLDDVLKPKDSLKDLLNESKIPSIEELKTYFEDEVKSVLGLKKEDNGDIWYWGNRYLDTGVGTANASS